MTFTLRDVADFCLANRKSKAFPGFTEFEVFNEIILAANNGTLHIAADEIGLCGVIIAHVDTTIYVNHIVCIRNGLSILLDEAFKRYPNLQITGSRNNTTKTFNKRNLLWAIARHQHRKARETC